MLRLWRTFCVNYEARTSSEPAEKKAKRKIKNYKLKHSRLLTCYSAILYLLTVFDNKGTVSPKDALEMIKLSPTARLEWLTTQHEASREGVLELLALYEQFLAEMDAPEEDLVSRFMDRSKSKEYAGAQDSFGDCVFRVLSAIGSENKFHRLLVV